MTPSGIEPATFRFVAQHLNRGAPQRNIPDPKNSTKNEIFMATVPLCSSLNKLHLFSLIEHSFILIQIVTFTLLLQVWACS